MSQVQRNLTPRARRVLSDNDFNPFGYKLKRDILDSLIIDPLKLLRSKGCGRKTFGEILSVVGLEMPTGCKDGYSLGNKLKSDAIDKRGYVTWL